MLKAGEVVSLSPTEFKLLRYLMLNAGRVLSKAQILDHVWNYDFGGDANVVESYISYLRRKIDTTEPRLLHTLRGRRLRAAAAPRRERTSPDRQRAALAAHAAARHRCASPLVALLGRAGRRRPARDRLSPVDRRCCAATCSTSGDARPASAGARSGCTTRRLRRPSATAGPHHALRRAGLRAPTYGCVAARRRRGRAARTVPPSHDDAARRARTTPSSSPADGPFTVAVRRRPAPTGGSWPRRRCPTAARSSSPSDLRAATRAPSRRLVAIEAIVGADRADDARRRRLRAGPQQPAAARRGRAHRRGHRRRRPHPAGAGGRRAHRGRPAVGVAQRDAHPDRDRLPRPAGLRGAGPRRPRSGCAASSPTPATSCAPR